MYISPFVVGNDFEKDAAGAPAVSRLKNINGTLVICVGTARNARDFTDAGTIVLSDTWCDRCRLRFDARVARRNAASAISISERCRNRCKCSIGSRAGIRTILM